jgi:hypothetical protein
MIRHTGSMWGGYLGYTNFMGQKNYIASMSPLSITKTRRIE